MNILIDMDGVLVDFIGGACRLFQIPKRELLDYWKKKHPGKFDCVPRFADLLDMIAVPESHPWHGKFDPDKFGPDEFWNFIRERGRDRFWHKLEPHPWAFDLWKACGEIAGGNVWIATAPARGLHSIAGKAEWLQNHLQLGPNRYMMGASKTLMARPDTILIDDRQETCEQFRALGGRAVLFPRIWNAKHKYHANAFAHAMADLGAIVDRLDAEKHPHMIR